MKLNKDNLIGVIIGFIVLVIFAICLSSGCAKRITPVPEIRYVPVTDSTAVNELVLTKELLRRTQDSLNAYKSDTTISADYFVAKIYKLERIKYYNEIFFLRLTIYIIFYSSRVLRIHERKNLILFPLPAISL